MIEEFTTFFILDYASLTPLSTMIHNNGHHFIGDCRRKLSIKKITNKIQISSQRFVSNTPLYVKGSLTSNCISDKH
jgi:hypothetical protein